jgi:hypothetical protein
LFVIMHVPVDQRDPIGQGPGELFIGALGLCGIGILIWALVYAAQFVLVSGFMLVGVVLDASADGLASNIFLSGIAGVFAGIAISTIRSLHRKPGNIEKSFVSALFSKGLAVPSLDGLFWAKVMLSAFVGLLVGAFSGADGFISFPQAITGTAGKMFSSNHIALIHFLSGGFGGSGAGFGGHGTIGLWSVLLLIIVIILTTLIIGALSGLFVHLIIKGLAGAAKSSTKELVLQSLEDPADGEDKGHPIGQGIIRGALTGVLVGLIEAVFTLWGIAAFYHSPMH